MLKKVPFRWKGHKTADSVLRRWNFRRHECSEDEDRFLPHFLISTRTASGCRRCPRCCPLSSQAKNSWNNKERTTVTSLSIRILLHILHVAQHNSRRFPSRIQGQFNTVDLQSAIVSHAYHNAQQAHQTMSNQMWLPSTFNLLPSDGRLAEFQTFRCLLLIFNHNSDFPRVLTFQTVSMSPLNLAWPYSHGLFFTYFLKYEFQISSQFYSQL